MGNDSYVLHLFNDFFYSNRYRNSFLLFLSSMKSLLRKGFIRRSTASYEFIYHKKIIAVY